MSCLGLSATSVAYRTPGGRAKALRTTFCAAGVAAHLQTM
eukprot:CAMPEP_0195136170 /NCGR_PEP_ID=MMETSP0448-20130528/153751_1 /TAXON_ID=66468 /ORGANISM="Heterocapsa triquestra, Strain CCMP 448" /LENGTH=39 /DNA_ID= /DNA_START= /DNA_END= /DNA_ORIENTATION=